MCFLNSLRFSQKLLGRLQIFIVFVVVVIEMLSVDSFQQAKNTCDDTEKIVLAEYDLPFKCAEHKQFACGTPQPRAVLLRQLLDFNITTPTIPNMIIIYRCENSGCCMKGHEECTNTSSTKHKVRYISNKFSGEMTIYNHTACSCQYISATQECFL